MSRWVTITIDDLNDHKVAAMVKALRTAALAAGQEDPMVAEIAKVTARIRRKIASCHNNRLDSNLLAIPKGLKALALDQIVYGLKNRLQVPLSDDEVRRQRIHEADLTAIARCDESIEQPDNPVSAAVESGVGMELISRTRPIASRDQTAGL